MRAKIGVAESIKNHAYSFFLTFIVFFIFFYLSVWHIYSQNIKKLLNISNAKYEITFDSVKTSGFVFMNTKIKNFKLRSLIKEKNLEFEIEEIDIRNLLFMRNFVIFVKNSGRVSMDKKGFILSLSNDLAIQLSLTSENMIKSIIVNGSMLSLKDNMGEASVEIQNLILERYTVYPRDDDTVSTVVRINIDKLIATEKTKNGEVKHENNFETVFSVVNDINEKKEILSERIELEKFVLNDVSNNFGFELLGNYDVRVLTKASNMNLLLKIMNYNSLVKSLNSKKYFLLVEAKYLSGLVEFLYFAPKNINDTVYNKHYSINFESSKKSLRVNGEEFNNIVRKSLFNRKQ